MSLLDALRRGIDNYPGGRISLRPRVDPGKSDEVFRKELSGATSHKLGAAEAVVPKAYNPAAGGEASGSSARLELLVEQLLAKVANLELAANTTANNTQLMPQMGRQFDTVTNGGTVLRNKAVA